MYSDIDAPTTDSRTPPDEVAPDRVLVANATVLDAFVDFNLGNSGEPELTIVTDEPITIDAFQPVADDPDGAWLAEANGAFARFQDGDAQPPADTSPKTTRHTIDHSFLSVDAEERVMSFDHVTKTAANKRHHYSTLGVRVRPDGGSPNSWPIRVELAQAIIDRYVNGPLGTETVSHTWYQREIESRYDWRDLSVGPAREGWAEYATTDVALVGDDTYTWAPIPIDEIGDDVVFDPSETYWTTCIHEFDTARTIYETPDEAVAFLRARDTGRDSVEYCIRRTHFDDEWEPTAPSAQDTVRTRGA